jgi:hypothetical protein
VWRSRPCSEHNLDRLRRIQYVFFFGDIAAHYGLGPLLYMLGFSECARDQMVENITKGDFKGMEPPDSI